MKPVSLADITYAQGLQLLQLRKQAVDAGKIRPMTPEALANTFVLRDIGVRFTEKAAAVDWESLKSGIKNLGQRATGTWSGLDDASKNVVRSSLVGGGLGTAAGLGKSLVSGEGSLRRNMLRGGIAGTAMGGGLGLALNPQLITKLIDKQRGVVEPTKPSNPSAAVQTAEQLSNYHDKSQPEIFNAQPDSTKAQLIKELQENAKPYAPESTAALQTGGIAATTGVLHKLAPKLPETFDKDRLARELAIKIAPKAQLTPSERAAIESMLTPPNLRMQTQSENIATAIPNYATRVQYVKDRLPSGTMLTGAVPKAVKDNVEHILGEGSLQKIVKKPSLAARGGRLGLLAAAANALFDAAGQSPITGYAQAKQDQGTSRQTLQNLVQGMQAPGGY